MLNSSVIQTIKSTVPVLEVHGTAITRRFYQLLFTSHPELLNMFNHVNQKQGRQQAALANVVYAAAQNIDRMQDIIPVVKQIGHKHRSLGVKPGHYPIVGGHLLAAIKDVLGDAATEDILAAWAEAYGVIADAFIGIEAEMYREVELQPGGWQDFRRFVVTRKVMESSVITSFYLEPQDGLPIAGYIPGQYVSVKLDIPGQGNTHIRQYSLSGAPGKTYYRITVKREDAAGDRSPGIVSTYLHSRISEGDTLLLSAPAGNFTLSAEEQEQPVVLISGGVGLTPLVSMLHCLNETQPERPVTFIHAAISGETHALKEEVTALAESCPQITVYFCYETPSESDKNEADYNKEGRIDLEWLQSIVPTREAGFYFCGPVPFMKQIYRDLKVWGVKPSNLHYEFFGPSGSLEA